MIFLFEGVVAFGAGRDSFGRHGGVGDDEVVNTAAYVEGKFLKGNREKTGLRLGKRDD